MREVSDQCAKTLGINVRVVRGCCDALCSKKGLHVAQVGSAFVEQERRRETGKNRGLRGHRLVILFHVSAKWTR